jgi:hypothetical protein
VAYGTATIRRSESKLDEGERWASCRGLYKYIKAYEWIHAYILSSGSAELRRAAMPGGSGMGGTVGTMKPSNPGYWMGTCNHLVAKVGDGKGRAGELDGMREKPSTRTGADSD